MKTWEYQKHISARMLFVMLFFASFFLLSGLSGNAAGVSFNHTESIEDETIFSVTVEGLTSTKSNGSTYSETTAKRGSKIHVHVNWYQDYPKEIVVVFLDRIIDTSTYSESDGLIYIDRITKNSQQQDVSVKSPWTRINSINDIVIECPKDPNIKMINVGIGVKSKYFQYLSYYDAVHGIRIYLDDEPGSSFDIQNVWSDALKEAGEFSTMIWNEIVEGISSFTGVINDLSSAEKIGVSLGGALATAGTLSAVGGGKNKKKNRKEEEKIKRTYKMLVYKGFGDAIRKGAKPVKVWARIVEIEELPERTRETIRDDLTEMISASGEGMDVRLIGMENNWQGAEVSIPKDSEAQTATLTFTFTGKGGVMHNRITFRIIGEPEIVFPRFNEDGTGWERRPGKVKAWMVAGKGGSDKVLFHIMNIMEEPKKISFRTTEALKVTCEEDPEFVYTYHACIENRTVPIEKENGVFADLRYEDVTIDALFEDGSVVSTTFSVELYPDGLSISAGGQFIQDGRLVIDTVQKENVSPGYSPFVPTVFYITVAYLNDEGQAVICENPGFSEKEPTDDGKYDLLFDLNFFYHIKHNSTSGIWFWPENTLPSLGDPYEAHMQIRIDDPDIDRPFSADIPLTVLGEAPKPAYSDEERAEALRLLKKDIKFFGLDNNKQLKTMVRLAMSGECSYDELVNIRYRVLEAAVDFYYKEGDAYKNFDKTCTNYLVVSSALVKGGDYALEYVLKKHFGGYGKLAAKFINPMKNILATYAGEIVENGNLDRAPDFIDSLLKGCEDALSAAITGVFFGDDDLNDFSSAIWQFGEGKTYYINGKASEEILDIIGYVIAVYLALRFVIHYTGRAEDKSRKGDIFRSALAACGDLAYESFIAWLGNFITDKCKKLFTKIGTAAGEQIRKLYQNEINEKAQKLGKEAFDSKIKYAIQVSDKRGLTKASLDEARKLRDEAIKESLEFSNDILDKGVKMAGEISGKVAAWTTESIFLGQILNFFLGGDEDGTASLGLDTKEILFTLASKIKVEHIHKAREGVNPYDVTAHIEDGKIVLGLFGYYMEIHILENISGLTELLMTSLFSWLNTLCKLTPGSIDPSSVPDKRKRVEKNVDLIRQELEAQRQRNGKFEWQYTEYIKKTKSGTEKII